MNININVTFKDGRCFFDGFNQRNDIDPVTKKAGVNYYRVLSIIYCILEKLGFAKGINCFENGRPKMVYINSKSFLRWRERHSNDEYITLSDTLDDGYSSKKRKKVLSYGDDFEGSIKFIIKSYKTLSYDKVMEKAEKEFPRDERKKMKIKAILDKCNYKERYENRVRPYIFKHSNLIDEGLDEFFKNLPKIKLDGVDKVG